jgi:methionyl-tRNA synthetase
MNPLYLTTAIPFVNAPPHLGHALELVETDAIARHARTRGRAVRFLTGTDENAPKNARAAAAAGKDVASFVTRNAALFASLADTLRTSYDDFIRTSADPRHAPAVDAIWRACAAAGDLYRAPYAGWYCAGCEQFVDGQCEEHDTPPEWVEEENWYFRLSRYAGRLRDLVGSGRLRIVPEARRKEVLAFLDGDVRDISVSRSRARARDWGIPVPGDPDQIVYVWFDALINYVSAAPAGWWRDPVERRHVIGKGIVRFHAVIWPAILCSAGLPLPNTLFVHDYLTADGRKIGKSLGNAVDPFELVDRYDVDALRWWLLREVPRVGEADFTEERLVESANRDLANGIGNLVERVVGLGGRVTDRSVRDSDGGSSRRSSREHAELRERIDGAIESFDLRGATTAICDEVDALNREIEVVRPWTLTGEARERAVGSVAEATRVIVDELAPFTPDLAGRAADRLRGASGAAPYARLAPVAIRNVPARRGGGR